MKVMIAGVITDATKENIMDELEKVEKTGADMAEIRVNERNVHGVFSEVHCQRNAGVKTLPIIAKLSGKEDLSSAYVNAISHLRPGDIVDIRLCADAKIMDNAIDMARKHGIKAIVSFHDFGKTPNNKTLEKIVSEARGYGKDIIVKIATLANDMSDVLRLEILLKNGDSPMTVLPMGEEWKKKRLSGPFLKKNAIIYGAMSIGKDSAPGQPTIKEIKDALNLIS